VTEADSLPPPIQTEDTPSETPTPLLNEDAEQSQPDVPVEAQGEEESPGGAFNPVTGEINWDCPCLGGMAHGPCGPEFREAFSCFVYSEKEPKGIDCVEKFKAMQNCFREHPDVYGDGELAVRIGSVFY
jgi:intermembrane space import and assembly protein 40